MKTRLLWLLVLATQTFNAQIQVNTQWANDVNEIFEDLDKSRIPHGILLDYAMEFIDVPTYNGVVTTSSGPFTSTSENYVDNSCHSEPSEASFDTSKTIRKRKSLRVSQLLD